MSNSPEKIKYEDWIRLISERTGFPRKAIKTCLDASFDILREQMLLGKAINIYRFGIFSIRHTIPKIMYDFTTKKLIESVSNPKVKFDPSYNFFENYDSLRDPTNPVHDKRKGKQN